MKKLWFIFVLLPLSLLGDIGLGFKLGTLNEISFISNDTQLGIGISSRDESGLSSTIDRLYRYDGYYYGIGLGFNTFEKFDIGTRLLIGFSAREEQVEFFAELGPAYYLKDRWKVEAGMGIRVYIY